MSDVTHGDREARRLALSHIADSFQESIALLTAVNAGVFVSLSESPKSSAQLCNELGLAPRETDLLLHAISGMDLLEKGDEGKWSLHGLADEFLRVGSDAYMGDILAHNHHRMQRWARMDEVLSSGEPIPRKGGSRSPRELRDFILGMQNISKLSAVELAEGLDVLGATRLLDLAGGPGTYLYELLRRAPGAKGRLVDFPAVIEIASEQRTLEGMEERAELVAGDIFDAELDGPWDLILLSNVIHSYALDQIETLLQRWTKAIAPGGRLVVKDFFLEDSGTVPLGAALFSLNMMIGNPGRAYRRSEIEEIGRSCGLSTASFFKVGSHSGVLVLKNSTHSEKV